VKLDKYKSNRRGLKDLLGSEGVRFGLVVRAAKIAAVAQAAYEADPPHEGHVRVTVESEGGHRGAPRARAVVVAHHPAVIAIEADRRVLGSAMDAA
jgi:hypothetical protein